MMAIPHKHRIARAFGRAAGYAAEAHIQRRVAEKLADRIRSEVPPPHPAILEIGCGTGFLTAALAARIGPADWTITDIAPEMIARAKAMVDIKGAYRVMDGEHPDLDGQSFDMIVSSLSFQWFADLPGSIARLMKLLRPGGLLAFSTMAAGSFDEWRAAHDALGLCPGTPAYPEEAALRAAVPDGVTAAIDILPFVEQHDDARAFLHRVKAIGAAVPAEGRQALSPASLRRVMAAYDAGPRTATYRIAFCLFRAPPIG